MKAGAKIVILATLIGAGTYNMAVVKEVEAECSLGAKAYNTRIGADYGIEYNEYQRILDKHGDCIKGRGESDVYKGCSLSLVEKLK